MMNIEDIIRETTEELNLPKLTEAQEFVEGKTIGCNVCDKLFDREHIVCVHEYGFVCTRCMAGAIEFLFKHDVPTPGYIIDDFRSNMDENPSITEEELKSIGAFGAFNKFFYHFDAQGFADARPISWSRKTNETRRCDGCNQEFMPDDMADELYPLRNLCLACWFNGVNILQSMVTSENAKST